MSYFYEVLIDHLVKIKPLIEYLLRGRNDKEVLMDKYDTMVAEILSAICDTITEEETT